MYKSYRQIEDTVLANHVKKTLALAGSTDDAALEAVVNAKRKGIIDAELIGDEVKTAEMLRELGEDPADYNLINEPDTLKAIRVACQRVHDGQADIPMKGLTQTADYLRALLDKSYGFVPEKGIITQATTFEYHDKLISATDGAVCIAPDYAEKVKILNNAVKLMHKLGYECPKVAVITPVEVVNPKIQSTIDAAMLTMANRRGQIKGCLVDGPLALDNAISVEAAKHKGIVSEVAGYADILLFPDLNSGNLMLKVIIDMLDTPSASNIVGLNIPVVLTSRADKPENKYNSILSAVVRLM